MLNSKELLILKENNRLEAKKSESNLPRSIWETYGAFANTSGGVILLGVSEEKDQTLTVTGVSDVHKIMEDFWNLINNRTKVSANILTNDDIEVLEENNKKYIRIQVKKAPREVKPVYINDDMFNGSYKRNHSGDYHCSKQEVVAMLRDQESAPDARVLSQVDLDALSEDTIRAYRNVFQNKKNDHVWNKYDNEKFLTMLGAVAKGEDGIMHPTVAGLLFFGYEHEIIRVFNDYFLDYQEKMTDDPNVRWTDRIYSTTGDWAGNLYEFHNRVYNKLQLDLPIPFEMGEGQYRKSQTDLHIAVREALTNCLVNADFSFGRGLVVRKRTNEMVFENPGMFRIPIEKAFEGGVSDPRNGTILKMFNLIDIGERSGSGIPTIANVFKNADLPDPIIKEEFGPDRTTLVLKIRPIRTGATPLTSNLSLTEQEMQIINYIKENQFITREKVEELLDVKQRRANTLLAGLIERQLISKVGVNKNTHYVMHK